MKVTATACAPFASSSFAAARISAGSSGWRIVPAAIAPPHLQRVAEAARRDHADLRPAPLEQRVGTDRGAVHDAAAGGGSAERREAIGKTDRLVAAARRHLRGAEAAARGVEPEKVGEGAADVDADDDAVTHVAARSAAVPSSSTAPSSRSTT